ncbi:ribosomal large subunit pseudouridine synthase B [Corallococcus coralloides DSM 2259]|uniref:Pseudouridine synthase n=1 Tax=Corallococcus coralloides (strain ATCC 25202 / DSM 2259 / NBRC 100086 / M2) TaxID=1144275 RepID=H8MXC6_CORCM|nr:pseudouridine synthase [Corallococcus coralloides]AFE10162.1 ribosomal large subunit pseudouridine synthase B [Corallococcus coralloides DSM 2259]
MAAERLQKYLARAGVASRRHAEELITSGRVGVNNETVTELGSRVEPGVDLVTVDGKLVTPPEESSYYLLYKPVGVVTTLSDPQGRPTVASYVEETGRRLFPVGRLDYDAEGALLFTDDGALAHKLTHPSFQVPRTYLAKVKGAPDMPTLEKLRGGVRLEDGMATPVSVDVFEKAERNTWLKIVVAEGRPHLIKRLCAAVGHPVVRLFRPNYAGVGVEGLRPGELRPLKTAEVMQLTEVAEGRAQPNASDLKLPPRRHGRSAPGFGGADDDDIELSMDDDAPVAPRKTERAAKKAPATGPKTREARPERKEWKGVQDGGTRPPKFAKRGATLAADDDADLDDVPTFDDEGDETESDAAEGATYGKAARGAGRGGKSEGERAPRGAARFGKPAGAGRSEGGASRGGGRFGAEGGASRGGGRFGAEGGASRGGGRFGKPAGAGRGGDEAPRGRFGKPARAGAEGDAPRGGGRFGKPAGGSRFGGEEGGARGGGRFGKPAGRFGDEGGARGGGRFGKPAGRFGGEEGGAPRGGGRFGKPAGAGRSEGGASRFGGEEGGARGAGRFGKPARAGRGGDEAPRSGFGRPARADAEGGASRGGDRFGKPSSRFGGEEGSAPRGGSRFGKPAGRGGDEGAPRGGGRFGAEGGASRGGGRFGKPSGRFGDEGGAPRGGGRFGKPAGRFGDEGGARGGGRFGKPAGRFGAEGGAPRGGGRFGKPAGGSRFGKPAGAGRGGDEGGAPRGRFGKPAGGSRFGGEEGGARGGGRFGKPAGAGRSEGGARGGARFGKPAGAGGDRPERREWKPRGESAGRPERKPRGEDSGSRSRGGGESSSSASGERIVRAGVKKAPPGERGGGYQEFKERKTRASEPRWNSKAPRGGAGRPPPRGGRSR